MTHQRYTSRVQRLEALLRRAYEAAAPSLRADIEEALPELAPKPSPRPWRYDAGRQNVIGANEEVIAAYVQRVNGEHIVRTVNAGNNERQLREQLNALADKVLGSWSQSPSWRDALVLAKGAKNLLQEVGDE